MMKKAYLILCLILECSVLLARQNISTKLLDAGVKHPNVEAKQSNAEALVLQGDYPDPTIIRDGKWYYMTHSAFDYIPGLTVLRSQDLKTWQPIGFALQKYIGSIWAPDICKYKGKYYIYFTVAAKGKPFKNFVVYTDKIDGEWSEPIDLHVDGKIDPCHVADEKTGERWLFVSGGNRVKLSADGLSADGKLEHVYQGWKIPRDWDIESTSLEGPKLKRVGDYYYYLSAQGGTSGPATSHMVVVARSKSLSAGTPSKSSNAESSALQAWENMPDNPLIHTWKPTEQWQSKGHGSLVDDGKGNWYVVFHTYEKYFQSLGRNTMIEPVKQTADGWWIAPLDTMLEGKVKPIILVRDLGAFRVGFDWKAYMDYDANRYQIANRSITIQGKGDTPASSSPLMFVAGAHRYELSMKVERSVNAVAGITLYYNKDNYAGIGFDSNMRYRFRRAQKSRSGSCRGTEPMWIKVQMMDNVLTVYTSYDGKKWNKETSSIELSGYNHNTLGDYQSVLPGIFVYGDGKATFSELSFKIL